MNTPDPNDILAALGSNILNFTQGPTLRSLPPEQQNNAANILNVLAQPQQQQPPLQPPLQPPPQPIHPFARRLIELKTPSPPSALGSLIREVYSDVYPNAAVRKRG